MGRLLAEYLERERVGHAVIAPADVIFSPQRAVQPDVFVTRLVNGRRPARIDVLADAVVWLPEGARSALALDVADYCTRVLDG